MRLSYILRLVLKNIINHKLRSIITIIGIVIGVSFIIILISFGYGLQRISTEEIANVKALQVIDVTPGKSNIVKIDDRAIDRFRGLGYVESVAPQNSFVGKFFYGTSAIEGVVYGKDTDYLKIEDVEYASGKDYTDNTGKYIVINKAALRALGLLDEREALGKRVGVTINISPEFLDDASELLIKEDQFIVSGVINTEDTPYAYVPLQIMKKYGVTYYNSAKIKVSDKRYTDRVKQEVESFGYRATALKETVDQINRFFSIFRLILLSFGIIAIIIASLAMFNTLTISLLEKTREIGFMKILGATRRDVWRIFIIEAIAIGIIGSTLGIFIGVAIGYSINNFLVALAVKTGNKPVEIFYTPSLAAPLTLFIATIISFLTGFYPSYRASKIDALEVMRYE